MRSPATTVIRIPATAHVAEVVLLLLLTLPAFTWPAASAWLLALPVLLAVWTERVRTEVSADGLRVRTLASSRRIGWDQLRGLRFPHRRWARADLTDGTEVPLPTVHFRDLPILAAASGGRIPDPYATERERPQDRADGPRE